MKPNEQQSAALDAMHGLFGVLHFVTRSGDQPGQVIRDLDSVAARFIEFFRTGAESPAGAAERWLGEESADIVDGFLIDLHAAVLQRLNRPAA